MLMCVLEIMNQLFCLKVKELYSVVPSCWGNNFSIFRNDDFADFIYSDS